MSIFELLTELIRSWQFILAALFLIIIIPVIFMIASFDKKPPIAKAGPKEKSEKNKADKIEKQEKSVEVKT